MKNLLLIGFSLFILFIPISAWAAGDPASGEKTYKGKCATCHGTTGEADGPAAKQLRPKPVNFVDDTKNNPPGRMGHKSDAELMTSIKQGVVGTAMPSWVTLSDQEVSDVLAYIRSIKKK